MPLSITDDTATLSRTVNRLATKKQKRGERKLEKHGPLHGMRPRFAAHARGKYEERSPIVSIREKFNPVARGSPPTSPRCYTLYRSSTALVIWLPGWRINTSCRDIVSRFRKSIANTCASAWPDRVPTIRFVFLPGPDLPPHLASPPSLARPPNQRIVRFFFRRFERIITFPPSEEYGELVYSRIYVMYNYNLFEIF